MGMTGLALFFFVVAHMVGNLQIFLGPDPINDYAFALKSRPWLLWPARLGLLIIAILHVTAAIQLARENRQARPTRYTNNKPIASSYAARTIVVSGLVILGFVLFHLSHFTFGFIDPEYLQYETILGQHDVYRMMIVGFSKPLVSTFYIVSMGLLCLHLSHGVSSAFQSLGLRNHKTLRGFNAFANVSAMLVFLGNCSIPLAILAGYIK